MLIPSTRPDIILGISVKNTKKGWKSESWGSMEYNTEKPLPSEARIEWYGISASTSARH